MKNNDEINDFVQIFQVTRNQVTRVKGVKIRE